MLRLAQQVNALLSCLEDQVVVYSTASSLVRSGCAGLFGDDIPVALHDTNRSILQSSFQCSIADNSVQF